MSYKNWPPPPAPSHFLTSSWVPQFPRPLQEPRNLARVMPRVRSRDRRRVNIISVNKIISRITRGLLPPVRRRRSVTAGSPAHATAVLGHVVRFAPASYSMFLSGLQQKERGKDGGTNPLIYGAQKNPVVLAPFSLASAPL